MKGRALGDFAQLGTLKEALARRAQETAEREARLRAEHERAQRERTLFAHSVGAVQPLAEKGHAALARTPPSPQPLQRDRDERAALRESISDEIDIETLLDTDEALS